MRVTAVCVNHNTSAYMELMLRSYDAMHALSPISDWVLYDNASNDDTAAVMEYAEQRGTPLQPSGYTTQTAYNSHGHLLQRGFLQHPNADYVVLLDADVVFTQRDTIPRLIAELAMHPTCWAIGVAPSWDGVQHIPAEVRAGNADICDARLHPCCAVIRNTPVVRRAVELFGFGTVEYHWPERAEYLDTAKLLTRVLLSHGLTHHVSSGVLVKHFFCTSYEWDDAELKAHKQAERDRRLAALRGYYP